MQILNKRDEVSSRVYLKNAKLKMYRKNLGNNRNILDSRILRRAHILRILRSMGIQSLHRKNWQSEDHLPSFLLRIRKQSQRREQREPTHTIKTLITYSNTRKSQNNTSLPLGQFVTVLSWSPEVLTVNLAILEVKVEGVTGEDLKELKAAVSQRMQNSEYDEQKNAAPVYIRQGIARPKKCALQQYFFPTIIAKYAHILHIEIDACSILLFVLEENALS